MRRTYIIAEAGVNHNGSLDLALQLVDKAVEAGADAVKFQTFRADEMVTKRAGKAEYQTALTDPEESQWAMLKSLELGEAAHHRLIEYCKQCGIDFISTPFDVGSVDLLAGSFDLPILKISSGDITNGPLLMKAAASGKKVILSTGMSTLGEIEQALAVLAFGYTRTQDTPSISAFFRAYSSEHGQRILRENVILLHCTSEYPCPFDEVNLRAMQTLGQAFQLPVGLSDHTPGIAVPIAAAALGAVVIEKHFTLDRGLPGPDHQASIEPDELKRMVESIRQVEQALGSPVKVATPAESKNKLLVRKSLVARSEIRAGDVFSESNLTVKRPGDGVSPMHYWDYLGRSAARTYAPDEQVTE
ncbi:MAG: N-acetylneuraminate synthase [Alicyclobacillus macrosporangiidus]|uniref:N-acetylneuraminate synthase n=1 Tax=Alicyclobacillus macrosporangiidus TaxID=392015 RepID=UPI0026F34C49|nr:N-acetylneuraminate synthase [Alicyclobacillus macrosporangiidus]MCL6598712.1 N-acetylneuraminate synthase [Alicyclobacillus macrosporangiidus]